MIYFFIAVVVVYAIWFLIKKNSKTGATVKETVTNKAGEKEKVYKVQGEDGKSIAVFPDRREVVFHEKRETINGVSLKYPFTRIRAWEYKFTTAEKIFGQGINVGRANSAAHKRAKEQTKFIVKIKDVDNPIFSIYLGDEESVYLQWMEIFDQFVNDGEVSEAPVTS
jgi:hypothetical protein